MMRLRDQSGFTLIEVMVAMAILAALSLLTAQTLKSTIDSRSKIQADIARESSVYDALRIMESDVEAAFHFRDINITMINELATEKPATPTPPQSGAANSPTPTPPTQPADPNQAAQPNPFGTPRPTPAQVTGFVGDAESMYFTVSNHLRTMKDAKESDQAKVGYFLKTCRSRTGKHEPSKCLVRGLSTTLDEDVTKVDSETVLLENVEEFKLRYLGPGHEDYVEQWKTGQNGDDTTRDNFPYAVEISLRVFNKNVKGEKRFGATVLAPIRFPNNPPKKDPNNPNDPNATPNSTGSQSTGGN